MASAFSHGVVAVTLGSTYLDPISGVDDSVLVISTRALRPGDRELFQEQPGPDAEQDQRPDPDVLFEERKSLRA